MLFLMMGSGNDVTNALARANGGYDNTLAEMNAAAADLGATDTRAATVSGLDGPGQMTSAYDLALFARADLQIPPFPELISTGYAQVPGFGPARAFPSPTTTSCCSTTRARSAAKPGFTDDAGNTYVGLAERNGRRLVVTMLGGTQQPRRQWMQAASLLDWGFALPRTTAPVGALAGAPTAETATATLRPSAIPMPTSSRARPSPAPATSAGPRSTTAAPAVAAPTALLLLMSHQRPGEHRTSDSDPI